MITAEYLMLEFEHALPKIEEITSSSLVMLAGDALAPTDVIRDVRNEARKEKVTDLRALADLIAKTMANHRKRLVTENVLRRRGLDSFDDYYDRAASLPNDLVSTLDTEIAAFEDVHEIADVEILLAGMDDSGPHLYLISKPGTSTCFDAIGYHAIGSGENTRLLRYHLTVTSTFSLRTLRYTWRMKRKERPREHRESVAKRTFGL